MKNYNLDIVMLVPGMPFDGDSLDKGGLGGSETAGLLMAKELAKIGHSVCMFSNCEKPGVYDKVIYRNVADWSEYASLNPHDVSIVQRLPESFSGKKVSKLNLLWQHDLALLRSAETTKSVLWNVDRVLTVSEYMTKQNKEVYGFSDEKVFWTTRNGIELRRFENLKDMKRNKKQLVYAARPERGLDVLVKDIMPKLLAKDPEYKLVVCGYDNTVPEMVEFYNEMYRSIKLLGKNAEWMGSLNKEDLYKLYASSGLYVYPTPSPLGQEFAEVSCLSLMECMAAGTPFLSSNKGALKETAGGEGALLLNGDPWTEKYQNKFVDKILDITTNEKTWERMSQAGRNRAKDLDWALVAEEWTEGMNKLIRETNTSPERLARHFIKRSDIIAAEKAIEGVNSKDAEIIKEDIEKGWGFRKSPELFEKHYREMGEITDERLSKIEFKEEYFDNTSEKRFMLIEQFLKESPGIKTVLDYGCGHGWCDIYMERKVGKKWLGIDVDPGAVKWSEKFKKFAKNPENLTFVTGDYKLTKQKIEGEDELFDCLLLTEVLEHCVDPIEVVESLEKWVKPGGSVLITVPYGPREYPDFDKIKHRNHLHELDIHTLKEMFQDKPGVDIMGIFETIIAELEEPAGFYIIRYRADQKPLGKIDWERKLTLQRPQQSVTAALIAGANAEETLHWCLRSLKNIVDDVVVADCGLNEEGKRILSQYNIRIIEGVNPLEKGFDTARNLTLPHCYTDWIFWMDTDERIFGGTKIRKYLRENLFHGYSIRQHHFAVDTVFKPDLPVRLFRNREWRSKKVEWFGHLHEHPEAGLNTGPGPSIILSDIHIAHLGYLYEGDRKKKFWRNYPVLKESVKKYPERLLNQHFIMRDNMLLCGYEYDQNQNRVTANIRKLSQETIEIFRKHFSGRGSYLNVDSLEYYSQACRFLGIGAEVAFCVNAEKQGNPEPQLRQYRFATSEDLEKEMEWRSKEVIKPFVSKWW